MYVNCRMTALHKSETSFFMLGLFNESGNLFSPVERPVFTPGEQASQFTGLSLSYRVNYKKTVYDRQILIATQIQKGENVLHGTCKISSKWKLCVLVLARTELTFAVARRGHGQDPEVILCHLTSFSRAGGRGPYQVLQNSGGNSECCQRWELACPSFFPCVVFYSWCCCHCWFSYLMAVSSKLFSSQPVIITFCASSCPFHPDAGAKGRESLSRSTKLGSTFPKPRHTVMASCSTTQHSTVNSIYLWFI